MRVLIIGSKGFIGAHLSSYLRLLGYFVLGCDIQSSSTCDADNYKQVSVFSDDFPILVKEFKPEYCINAAGSGTVSFSLQYPVSDLDLNVKLVAALLDSIHKYSAGTKVLHISSAAVYGNHAIMPIYENAYCDPVSPYGFHKLMSELVCKEYHLLYNVNLVIVRPFSIYGEGLRKQLLWDLCNKCYENMQIDMFGSGSETRDFMHINDLCYSFDMIMKKSAFKLEIYNLGNGKSTSIGEVSRMIAEKFISRKINFNNIRRQQDPVNMRSDISKIAALGYAQTISLSKGIDDYIKWFLSVVK